jgi:hypothetical protein
VKKAWSVVESYSDRSGVMRVYGPYASEVDAVRVIPRLEEFFFTSGGIFEVIPIWDVTPEGLT